MTKITCCRDCADRHVGCHAECEAYKAEKEQREKDRAHVKLLKDTERGFYGKFVKRDRRKT